MTRSVKYIYSGENIFSDVVPSQFRPSHCPSDSCANFDRSGLRLRQIERLISSSHFDPSNEQRILNPYSIIDNAVYFACV